MKINIDYDHITRIFSNAENDGRNSLFEYETYNLLDRSGAESTPRTRFLEKNSRVSNEEIAGFPGEKVVLKILSPSIVHKSDVRGVCVVDKKPGKVRSASRLYELMAETMEKGGLPIFRTCDAAVTTLAKYSRYRLRIAELKQKSD